MINEVILVGKIANKPAMRETQNGNKMAKVIIQIEKGFRNGYGIFESDHVPVILWKGIAESLIDCTHEGSFVSIKGRLQSYTYEVDETKVSTLEVVAEKVTFMDKYFAGDL